ncbi:UDP-glucose dehydrogenase family protein [Chengkuizengella axinellae]|uniref:UDP-glucose 6-dehydrogenase n=1 Tax=Chengkuizengella axinellae TaxID=3064388 RepID=A0ABT9J467_9BACL|nr:UDP-glucose/GDP-mannose dehydrogenase family protein [Chengkuizengella sp. 2205SS18-9]MDP5276412.1 UDP-glucose/GDP-mannose dehydrogenase family protein [Chengkuizengella sp. 2205SS18-9]
MEICVIGAGYVGLTSSVIFARLGHKVNCVDKDADKIKKLQEGSVTIFEPGLEKLLVSFNRNMSFSTNIEKAIEKAEVILIAVGTPPLPDGEADLQYVNEVIQTIASLIYSHKTIITKSTVPIGTNDKLVQMLLDLEVKRERFNVVSNPEFLREGSAVFDMLHPDKIVVGLEENDKESLFTMKQLYYGIDAPFIVTSLKGAEMIKYASNSFLATKISFMNEMARICDTFNVDIMDIAEAIGTDPRIGSHFLKAGIGYGGSCFPKDLKSLIHTAQKHDLVPKLLMATEEVNQTQVDIYMDKLTSHIPNLSNKNCTVLGLSFKPNTDDTRSSPAIKLINKLVEQGANVHSYDPKAIYEQKNVIQHHHVMDAIKEADCVIITTDWNEFLHLDWKKIKKNMRGNLILDARNLLNKITIEKHGLRYVGVGR